MNTRVMVCAFSLALSGCVLGPNFEPPKAVLAGDFKQHGLGQAAPGSVQRHWWDSFGDAQLSALVQQARRSNFDLQIAASRLQQSRAARRSVAADALPAVNAGASYARARNSENGLSDPSGNAGRHNYNLWSSGLDFSWEVDLWGRVKRSKEVADANVQLAEEDRHAVLLAVAAETARDYIQLRGTQNLLKVLQDNLGSAQQTLRLTRLQLREGVATDLQVAEAAAQVAAIQAGVPPLEQQQARLVNAVSLLVAREPGALASELATPRPVPASPRQVPVGLPSELAQRRPDIRRAEADLHAATAAIGMAEADFYPRITLSADLGLQAVQMSSLGRWGSHDFAAGPGFSVPLFQGGRLQGQLQLSEARQQEAAIRFQQTVLGAWHEVDDALSGYQAEQQRHASLGEALSQSRRAFDSAQRQYRQGSVDFINVLGVQASLLANQSAEVQSQAAMSLALVDVYKALGGGWEGG